MAAEVAGRTVSRVALEDSMLHIDLRLASGRQLLASVDRTTPALYLSSERAPDASRTKRGTTFFLALVRKHLVGAKLLKVWKEPLDRIVLLEFENLDPGDNRVRFSLRLMFTGRSSNAYLTDASGSVIGMLFDQGISDRFEPQSPGAGMIDPATLTRQLSESTTRSEVLDKVFGAGSVFGPQLKNEFLVRSANASPLLALESLIDDLLHKKAIALVYSKLPPEQIRDRVINPKTDLLLSHIELAQARGMLRLQYASLSEAADTYYNLRGPALALRSEYGSLKQTLAREISRRVSVLSAIETDRSRFDQPEILKQYGDLILANLARARIKEGFATVTDYYDPTQPEIQIAIPEGATLQEAASSYFARYQKARRALAAIASRAQEVSSGLAPLKQLLHRLENEPTAGCIDQVSESLDKLLGTTGGTRSGKDKPTRGKNVPAFGRRFKSTDGYEIVVGRNDRDNDALTFRVAKPNDIWLHAADYPGSHAIIRNPTREPPPHRTITEAAELAAFYSQAKHEGKAAVHYAQKKFVSKPPRSKPGLVRLSSFKTILVEPRCNLERLG